jgi:hypothetical protein
MNATHQFVDNALEQDTTGFMFVRLAQEQARQYLRIKKRKAPERKLRGFSLALLAFC